MQQPAKWEEEASSGSDCELFLSLFSAPHSLPSHSVPAYPLDSYDAFSTGSASIYQQDEEYYVYDDPNLDPHMQILGRPLPCLRPFVPSTLPPSEDESPYPEVRSAVANTDDPEMPAGTLRAWFLGILWAILIPGLNQFFFFRYPNVTVGSVSCPSRVFSTSI